LSGSRRDLFFPLFSSSLPHPNAAPALLLLLCDDGQEGDFSGSFPFFFFKGTRFFLFSFSPPSPHPFLLCGEADALSLPVFLFWLNCSVFLLPPLFFPLLRACCRSPSGVFFFLARRAPLPSGGDEGLSFFSSLAKPLFPWFFPMSDSDAEGLPFFFPWRREASSFFFFFLLLRRLQIPNPLFPLGRAQYGRVRGSAPLFPRYLFSPSLSFPIARGNGAFLSCLPRGQPLEAVPSSLLFFPFFFPFSKGAFSVFFFFLLRAPERS